MTFVGDTAKEIDSWFVEERAAESAARQGPCGVEGGGYVLRPPFDLFRVRETIVLPSVPTRRTRRSLGSRCKDERGWLEWAARSRWPPPAKRSLGFDISAQAPRGRGPRAR